jgi:hypothetical protein
MGSGMAGREPADGGTLPAIAPGQYVSVFVDLSDGDRDGVFGPDLRAAQPRRIQEPDGQPCDGLSLHDRGGRSLALH